MRLIDAEEIRYTSLKDGFGRIKECIAFSTDIEKTPTVKAIPIEWITDWLAKQTVPATSYGIDYSAVDKMLEDWERENES